MDKIKLYIEGCIGIVKDSLDKILRIPEIVAGTEAYLLGRNFRRVEGELDFWIATYETDEKLKPVMIEIIVKLARHSPTKLRFRRLFHGLKENGSFDLQMTDVIFEYDLLKFEENLHMQGEDLEPIRELWKKRIMELCWPKE